MKQYNYPGKFVAVEGLDGSGQSTQVELIKEYLGAKGREVVITKEPTTASPVSHWLRDALAKKIDIAALTLQELFAKDRQHHLESLIIPALKKGKVVISDRYAFSSFAFGQAAGCQLEKLIKLNEDFLMPDIVFFLDVRPKICIERIKKRGSKRMLFEKQKMLARVYQNFKDLTKQFPEVKVIDGGQNIDQVFEQIKSVLKI